MSRPSFRFRLPPSSLFKFPPDPFPPALPPPPNAHSFSAPFTIDADLYNKALDWKVPITVATLYATTAIYLNSVNKRNGNKPWKISQTRAFFAFVIVHNVFLAVFSGLTFVALLRALRHTWPSYREYPWLGKLWPGIRTQNGLAGAADAMCKLHGPRGLGDSAYFSPSLNSWTNRNRLISLGANGAPDFTDLGRIWNEGLAFWGWWFYLSKFYEVLDTAIILAKGKRSSGLQTYHHMGAMVCMWAGIRFMSPPIWMFCFVNAGIHALMYTYYTLSALGVRVPRRMKKTLTTMQISQFLIGFTFACMHLFVEYSVPVSVPYTLLNSLKAAPSAVSSAASSLADAAASSLSSAGSTVSSAASSVTSVASSAVSAAPSVVETATASAPLSAWLKKILLRAAGEEGLAENVRDPYGNLFGPEASAASSLASLSSALSASAVSAAEKGSVPTSVAVEEHIPHFIETTFRTEYQFVPCIDTTGQSFAIWLNLLYLAPLTWLFVRFFIRAYKYRTGAAGARDGGAKSPGKELKNKKRRVEASAKDAAKGTEREVDKSMQKAEDSAADLVDSISAAAKAGSPERRRVSATIQSAQTKIKEGYAKGEEQVRELKKKASQDLESVRANGVVSRMRRGSAGSVGSSHSGTGSPAPSSRGRRSVREDSVAEEDAAAAEKGKGEEKGEEGSEKGRQRESSAVTDASRDGSTDVDVDADADADADTGAQERDETPATEAEHDDGKEKEDQNEKMGLSSTDPKDLGESYAHVAKGNDAKDEAEGEAEKE